MKRLQLWRGSQEPKCQKYTCVPSIANLWSPLAWGRTICKWSALAILFMYKLHHVSDSMYDGRCMWVEGVMWAKPLHSMWLWLIDHMICFRNFDKQFWNVYCSLFLVAVAQRHCLFEEPRRFIGGFRTATLWLDEAADNKTWCILGCKIASVSYEGLSPRIMTGEAICQLRQLPKRWEHAAENDRSSLNIPAAAGKLLYLSIRNRPMAGR